MLFTPSIRLSLATGPNLENLSIFDDLGFSARFSTEIVDLARIRRKRIFVLEVLKDSVFKNVDSFFARVGLTSCRSCKRKIFTLEIFFKIFKLST